MVQTRSIDLPSDSSFAVAMRSQQQAERAEQQRIKSLVLNYDLNDDQHDGEDAFHYVLSPSSKRTRLVGKGTLNKSLPTRNGNSNGSRSQHSTCSVTENIDVFPPMRSDATISEDSSLPLQDSFADETGHIDHPHSLPRLDKSGNTRSKQRARKLQMGDINDWYGNRSHSTPAKAPPTEPISLDAFVREKQPRYGVPSGGRAQTSQEG